MSRLVRLAFALAAAFASLDGTCASQLVPGVGVRTRVVGGNFEIAAVKRNGTHAPFVDFEMRGVALGYAPQCQAPSVDAILASDFHAVLDRVEALEANTLRVYGLFPVSGPDVGTARTFLDRCYETGVYVIATTPNWPVDDTTSVSGLVQQQLAQWAKHPAFLGLCIGNEWTLDTTMPTMHKPWPPAVLEKLAKNVETIASVALAADPTRVVMTSVHEHPDFKFLFNTDPFIQPQTWIQRFSQRAPSIGLWGLQLFRAHTLQPAFFHWTQQVGAAGDAWILSEFGADSYDSTLGAEAQAAQAAELATQWDEVHRFSAGPFASPACAGSIVFELADEWWKAGNRCSHDPTSYATDICTQVPGTGDSICYAGDFDGHRSEEYLGLMELVPPASLAPKPAYDAIAARFGNAALPVASHMLAVRSQGFLTGGGLANGYARYQLDGNTLLHVCGGCPSPDGPGLSIVRIDRSTGGVAEQRLFNTLDSAGVASAINYVTALLPGELVAAAIVDTLYVPPAQPSAQLIALLQAKLGVTKLTTSIPFRAGWAAIGVVGAAAPLDESAPQTGLPPLDASAVIALDLDADGLGDAVDTDLDGDALANAAEQQVGTDPVDPRVELYVMRLSQVPVTGELRIEVRAGHPSASFLASQLDLASFSITLNAPVHIGLTQLFPVLFTQLASPPNVVVFQSIVPPPAGLDLRIACRLDQTNGEILIDELRVP